MELHNSNDPSQRLKHMTLQRRQLLQMERNVTSLFLLYLSQHVVAQYTTNCDEGNACLNVAASKTATVTSGQRTLLKFSAKI